MAVANLNDEKLVSLKAELPDALTLRCDASVETDVKRTLEDTCNHYFGGLHDVLIVSEL